MQDQVEHDAFADAKLSDAMRLVANRRNYFQAIAFEHVATQDCVGGDMVETISVKWRPLPQPSEPAPQTTNGHSHGPLI